MDVLFLTDKMNALTNPLGVLQLMHIDDVVLLTRNTSTESGAATPQKNNMHSLKKENKNRNELEGMCAHL